MHFGLWVDILNITEYMFICTYSEQIAQNCPVHSKQYKQRKHFFKDFDTVTHTSLRNSAAHNRGSVFLILSDDVPKYLYVHKLFNYT